MGKRVKIQYICQDCDYVSPKWVGRCPGCSAWNTMAESTVVGEKIGVQPIPGEKPVAIPVTEIRQQDTDVQRWETGLPELDRVLGGGLVPGSLVLVGGDPGVGKSTLWLQVASSLARGGHGVLYVSGEESVSQLGWRAERLSALHESLRIGAEVEMGRIRTLVDTYHPHVMIIDSIQTMVADDVGGLPGSVVQIRACTGFLLRLAKGCGIATIVVGHVTKAGELAGPRLLEHMVDAVLYLEGDRHRSDRLLRSVKNRFGSTCELGIFAMRSEGFIGIPNPSERLLADRPLQTSGTAIVAALEGTRPLLVELQGLVAPTRLAAPRRTATGLDVQRLHLLVAVLEKRLGISLQQRDVFFNVVGGLTLSEPAVDLAAAIALISSARDEPTRVYDAFLGEIGLTGEIRGISRIEVRLAELTHMGFQRAIVPMANYRELDGAQGLQMVGTTTLEEAARVAFEG
ncbi:DNA repair protein RadA [Pasteuria penetrans]|uniref:DNA repair protein RadA n=1 Tax=Pasteuria penetrans TaxID=86005 RepID=UPI001FE8428A|nr:DNA repair protein RadA [Pasteuria penetrans]